MNHFKGFLLILLMSLTVLTCSKSNTEKVASVEDEEDEFPEVNLGDEWPYFNLKGEFQSFQLDSTTSGASNSIRHYEDKNGNEFLFLLNQLNNSVYKYRVEYGEVEAVYKFEREGPKGVGNLDGFDVLSIDRLVLLSKYEYKLSIANLSNGVKIEQSINLLKRNKGTEFTAFATTATRIILRDQTLILSSFPFIDPVKQNLQSAGKSVTLVNLQNAEIEYRNLYSDKYRGGWPSHYQRLNATYNELTDKFIYSLPADSRIVEWDFKRDKKKYYDVKSQFFKVPSSMVENEDTDKAAALFLTQNPNFGQIHYDKYRNVYYRFTQRPFGPEVRDPDNGYVHKARFNGLMILDESFNVIKEIEKLTPNPVDMVFVGKRGLYLKQFTNDEDVLKFKVLRFE